jgi:hypothetical protein
VDDAADAGQWTMLTGVYDAADGVMELYVNGQLKDGGSDDPNSDGSGSGTAFTQTWQATGTLSIGRGRTGSGAYGDPLTGMVAGAKVWTGLVSSDDLFLDSLSGPGGA